MHWRIGWGGYFGNRRSVCDSRQSRNREPRPDTTSRMWLHDSHKLGGIGSKLIRIRLRYS